MSSQEQVEQENLHLFLYQLMSEFEKVNNEIYYHLGHRLRLPRFVVNRQKWGKYNNDTRTLSLHEDLFKQFEWGAVVHVLKHEMAHMVVREVFGDLTSRSHGEAFAKACKVVECDTRCCVSNEFLAGFKGKDHESPIVEKIRKLMAKGQCEGASEAEAEAFLGKASSLMSAHNISNVEVMGTEKCFVARPVGGKHVRYPKWLFAIGRLVCENYNVEQIRTYTTNPKTGQTYSYLEIFGEVHNVEVADYVFHVLLNQINSLYEKFKKSGRKTSYRKISKSSYVQGLIQGYRAKLHESKVDSEDFTPEQNALILANDAMLKEKYHDRYPNMRMSKSKTRGAGFSQGQGDAGKLSIHTGVGGSSKGRLQLNG